MGSRPAFFHATPSSHDAETQFRYYFAAGTGHTFLAAPGTTTAQGIPLWTWLTQFVNDDPAWKSTKP